MKSKETPKEKIDVFSCEKCGKKFTKISEDTYQYDCDCLKGESKSIFVEIEK